jgi:hypothetical protein
MTLTIEVAPDRQAVLQEEAARRGLSAEQLAGEMLDDSLQDLLQDAEDIEEARYRLANPDPRPNRTLADLRAHIEGQSAT